MIHDTIKKILIDHGLDRLHFFYCFKSCDHVYTMLFYHLQELTYFTKKEILQYVIENEIVTQNLNYC